MYRLRQRECHRCELRIARVPLPAHVAAGWHHVLLHRSNGSLLVCSVERMGHNTNTLYLVMDQNAADIGYDTTNMFTVTRLRPLPTASFKWSFALNFSHPRETSDYFVHHMGSTEGRPMHDSFASVGASGGVAYISSSATMVRANTTLVVVHQPAVTCHSTPEFPCWIVLEAPERYTLFSGGAPVTDLPFWRQCKFHL